MDAQKEALRRIISTLANKNEELQNFLETVDNTLTGLQEESCKVMSDLEVELEKLNSALEEKGAELRDIIKEEKRRKEAELQKQLSEGKYALFSCEELLEFANQTLTITTEEEFLQAAKQIKERVTMAPAFRLTTRPAVSENMTQFTVDFSAERVGLQRLHFLPVPRAPEIDISKCVVYDNNITVAWQPAGEADDGINRPIERYELEYRKTNRNSSLRATGEACWEKICDITETQVTISGLKFDSLFVIIRVRAKNKTAAGEFSEPVTMETRAYNFGFDASTAHTELKVQGDTVIWEPQGVKGHDPRLRGKESKSSSRSTTPSPSKTAGSRAGRDRFAGESYTVLGDKEMMGGCHYWELRPLADWKSFSVGVAYRASLGRFDQLGKSASSWCLHASQWLQSSLAVKHNNRAKALDWPLPQRIGIYCDYDNGVKKYFIVFIVTLFMHFHLTMANLLFLCNCFQFHASADFSSHTLTLQLFTALGFCSSAADVTTFSSQNISQQSLQCHSFMFLKLYLSFLSACHGLQIDLMCLFVVQAICHLLMLIDFVFFTPSKQSSASHSSLPSLFGAVVSP